MNEGLKRSIEIINDEMEIAVLVDPMLAMGMLRIKELLEQELKIESEKLEC